MYSALQTSTQAVFEAEYNPLDSLPTQDLADEHPDHIKWAAIQLWETGDMPAKEAIFWLSITGHISPHWHVPWPNEFLRQFVQLERQKAQGGAA
jgi:hypothetical protein